MKSKFVAITVIAVAALSGVSAFAKSNVQNRLEGEAATVAPFDTASTKLTSAQVQAEYLLLSKNNALPLSAEAGFPPVVVQSSSLTREQVKNSLRKIHALDGSEKLTQH